LREEHLRYGDEVFCMRMLEGRPLAFIVGGLELLASFISWSYSTSERGALALEADSFLVGYLAIRLQ
jgi:hypothetical protein